MSLRQFIVRSIWMIVLWGFAAGVLVALLVAFTQERPFPVVPPGHVAILTRKVGRSAPDGAIIVPKVQPGETPYQGVQLEVLGAGWHPFRYDPYRHSWEIVPLTDIPAGHVGVLVRLFGEDLPAGRVLADEGPDAAMLYKGVLAETLEAGTHSINTRAYDVIVVPRITIESSQVGVVTRRVGPMPADGNAFLSADGERGVQTAVLSPGSHYLNPFLLDVLPVSRKSQRLDLAAAGRSVRFPTQDGFEIGLNGTVEWSLGDEAVPLVFVKFGGIAETEKKLLLPAARAISRIHGTRKPAREFITGTTRSTFQGEFENDLRSVVEAEGPKVHAVLISELTPPTEIAKPIQQREMALRVRDQYLAEMEAEAKRAELLAESEAAVNRPTKIASARTVNRQNEKKALTNREERLIEVRSLLSRTRFDRTVAIEQATARRAQGLAETAAKRVTALAELQNLAQRIKASGGGSAFARIVLYEKIAPRYRSILSNTDGPLVRIFDRFGLDEPSPDTASRELALEEER